MKRLIILLVVVLAIGAAQPQPRQNLDLTLNRLSQKTVQVIRFTCKVDLLTGRTDQQWDRACMAGAMSLTVVETVGTFLGLN